MLQVSPSLGKKKWSRLNSGGVDYSGFYSDPLPLSVSWASGLGRRNKNRKWYWQNLNLLLTGMLVLSPYILWYFKSQHVCRGRGPNANGRRGGDCYRGLLNVLSVGSVVAWRSRQSRSRHLILESIYTLSLFAAWGLSPVASGYPIKKSDHCNCRSRICLIGCIVAFILGESNVDYLTTDAK